MAAFEGFKCDGCGAMGEAKIGTTSGGRREKSLPYGWNYAAPPSGEFSDSKGHYCELCSNRLREAHNRLKMVEGPLPPGEVHGV